MNIAQLFKECWKTRTTNAELPTSLIQNIKMKKALQIVYKRNKGWIFDYKKSVLYTLTQVAALFVYAIQNGCSYKDTIKCISSYYDLPINRVDADFQEFLAEMYKLQLIELIPNGR